MSQRPHQGYYDPHSYQGSQENYFHSGPDMSQYSETLYSDQFPEFLSAIKSQNYTQFKAILNAHREYKNRIDPETKQPPVYTAAVVSNEDLAMQMVKDLVAAGADPGEKDPLRQNVMSYLARDGREMLFNYFVSMGVSPTEIDTYQQMPLFYAAREGRFNICKKILEMGGDPNHLDLNGQTCLFYAAKSGHLNICQLLVEYGCKYDLTDKINKETALIYAKKERHKDVVQYLQSLKSGNKIQREKSAPPENKFLQMPPQPQKKKAPVPSVPKEKGDQRALYKLVFTPNSSTRVDVTEKDFHFFQQKYPELAGYLMNPNTIPVGGAGAGGGGGTGGEEKKKDGWEKIANKILAGVWKVKGAFIFHQPVDAVKLNCLDYYKIVSRPMDFGTIKNYLKIGHYRRFQEFYEDMNLVFQNCYLYNGTGGEVGKTGLSVEEEYIKLCKSYNYESLLREEMKSETKEDNKSMDYGGYEIGDDYLGGDMKGEHFFDFGKIQEE